MKKLIKTTRKLFSKGAGEKGFTLIELLVVVGILGVLAGVVTLNLGSFVGAGDQAASDTELHNIQTAVTAFQAANAGVAPADVAALVTAGYLLTAPATRTYAIAANGLVTKTN